jgi:hypothetical protein
MYCFRKFFVVDPKAATDATPESIVQCATSLSPSAVGTLIAGQLQAACRKQMLAYKREMEAYSSCANDAGQAKEGQIAEDEFKATLAQFNRRARGE